VWFSLKTYILNPLRLGFAKVDVSALFANFLPKNNLNIFRPFLEYFNLLFAQLL